ncbi:MAG: response regulator transcription factor [Lachnospiraceae bacterium]|nr:response regulator transcription factor [Lachnospiraceae bacterium]
MDHLKIAVCEDSFPDMDLLKKMVPDALTRLNLHMETDYFYSGEDLVGAVTGGTSYALLLLDIYMHALDGIQTAHRIRGLQPDVQIAFLTSSQGSMLEAFDLNALHYLVKPVSMEKLEECLDRFCDRIRIPRQTLEIRSATKTYTFPLILVQKIMSCNKGIDVYIQGAVQPQHIPISFTKAEEQLDPARFLRLSRGIMVQLSFILCINRDICRLKDGTEILISRRDKTAIRKKYYDHLFQK